MKERKTVLVLKFIARFIFTILLLSALIASCSVIFTAVVDFRIEQRLSETKIESKSGDIWLCVACIEEFGEWCPKREVKHWIDVYDFKFPHIVYAIFRLESGHGTSRIFLEQNNPFGFRQADRRLTTQLRPSQLPFAKYASIEAAVIDFLILERLFFHGESESEFLKFLDRIYCPSDYWIDRLIGVKRMNLWSN